MKTSDYHPFKSLKAKTRYLAFEDEMIKKWPIAFEEKTVKTSYGQTFMRISGPNNGKPLVLLPGGGSNSMIWYPNIKALSSYYKTYALDNIYDFGRSIYTKKMETYHDFTHWLDELFNNLSLGQNIRIAGYSYGGWVASNYAAANPERLSKVILIAPAFSIQPITKSFIWNMVLSLLPLKYTRRLALYSVWKDLLKSGEEGKEIVDERVDYFNVAIKCFKFKMGVQPNMLTDDDLNKLKMPVLYMIGEHDNVCKPERAIERLNSIAPKIETELIQNTGHDLMYTHTEKINKLMLDFLE
ncbi:alpha/beta fold hydrolase [Saccharicrinis sp. FJH54]|uniref:alpha/beta fold hydrolase n=1 Tax=Saccharicrinis sp. FJH54 TaxID=3344665 RepID=UPI0035D41A14